MLKIVLTTTFLAALCALTVNCSKDACQTYTDDATAKFNACGVTTGTTTTCTSALATKANCLDACLSSFDCCFLKTPTDPTCVTKEMTYSTCSSKC